MDVQTEVPHPLWWEQVACERGMLRDGAAKVKARITELKAKEQMAEAAPLRGLMDEWLPKIGLGVRDWCNQMERQRGTKPLALQYLKEQDPFVCALIALRAVLNVIGSEKVGLVGLGAEIGETVEHEAKVRAWEASPSKEDREAFLAVNRMLDRNKATGGHRARVQLAHFGQRRSAGSFAFNWVPWGREARLRVGLELISIIVRHAPWFEITPDPLGRFDGPREPKLVVAVRPEMSEWLAKALDRMELMSPEYKPTVIPPKRWTGSQDGGYWTPYVRQKRLVRFKASQESQQDCAADEYDAIDMPNVYKALHALQETAWRVNERVLAVAETCWALDQRIAGLPQQKEYDYPPRTARMEHHKRLVEEARANGWQRPRPDEDTLLEIEAWKREAAPIYAKNARREAHLRGAKMTLKIASEFRYREAIYFPYMLDFRGRLYPIPAGLQPQGDDLARGLLTFSDACPIDEEGAKWLAIALASTFGDGGDKAHPDMDKEPYDVRISWAYDNKDLWLAIDEDPVGTRAYWMNADKPWQCLAAIMEFAGWLRQGPGYLSSLPCMVDGTCNGIQHLSALTRDGLAGKLVNLVPGERPEDIYRFVAVRLQETVERISRAGGRDAELADYWLNITGGAFNRKMTKRQVMVLPYGGTKDSFFTYTRKWLDEEDPAPDPKGLTKEEAAANRKLRNERLGFMVNLMWDEVKNTVKGGSRVMEWLQKCASKVVEGDQPIYWRTPSGMVVRHFYGVTRSRKVELLIDGERRQLRIAETTNKLSVKEQLQGIAPNYIHSLDASALVTTVCALVDKGMDAFCTIHDAYGTHAANMGVLSAALRDAFVETHEHDLLGEFRHACLKVMIAARVARGSDPLDAYERCDEMLPPPLEMGELNLAEIRKSAYFFA